MSRMVKFVTYDKIMKLEDRYVATQIIRRFTKLYSKQIRDELWEPLVGGPWTLLPKIW